MTTNDIAGRLHFIREAERLKNVLRSAQRYTQDHPLFSRVRALVDDETRRRAGLADA